MTSRISRLRGGRSACEANGGRTRDGGVMDPEAFGYLVGQIIVYSLALLLLGLLLWCLWIFVLWATPKTIAIIVAAWTWAYRTIAFLIRFVLGIGVISALIWILSWLSTETTYLGPRGGRFRIRHSRRSGKKYKQYF